MLQDLVKRNRSYRKFVEEDLLNREILRDLVDLARLTASATNKQPLKYVLVSDPKTCASVFPCLAWAGFLTDWEGPAAGERPSGYIIILSDPELNPKPDIDVGIAAQSILLGATEKGLGGCLIGSIKRTQLKQVLDLPNDLNIKLVVALGKPHETVKIEDVGPDGNTRYWRDENQVHYVPKRKLAEIIIGEH